MRIGLLGASVAALALLIALASTAQASTLKVLYAFCAQSNCADGNAPYGTLLRDAAGVLYGTTSSDGAHGGGNVFALTPNGSGGYDFQVLYDFCSQTNCTDGSGPSGGLIEDVEGNLYGTTNGGGPNSYGVAYKLIHNRKHTAWKLQVLYNFCAVSYCGNGASVNGLTYKGASSGALYDGVSPLYGTSEGVIYANSSFFFKLEPHRPLWREKILTYFCPTAGCNWTDGPSSVFDDGAGNFYGTAFYGIGATGYVFELTPQKNAYVIHDLYDFCQQPQCADGIHPSGVIRDQAGNFFGTEGGGSHADGMIYELTPGETGLQYKMLHDFCSPYPQCDDGRLPSGPSLTLAPNGDLYGSAQFGGKCQQGVLFRLRAGRYQVVHDLCSIDGFYPATRLTLDPDGNMFGTTTWGGVYGHGGTVFEFIP